MMRSVTEKHGGLCMDRQDAVWTGPACPGGYGTEGSVWNGTASLGGYGRIGSGVVRSDMAGSGWAVQARTGKM